LTLWLGWPYLRRRPFWLGWAHLRRWALRLGWPYLRRRPFWLGWAHLRRWPLRLGWPYLRRWAHRRLIDRPDRFALLHGRDRSRHPPFHWEWPGDHDRLRPSVVH
jgi:hypothetical protein